ncbi:hypothetical protein DFH06DRAFT_1141155 [Mycena polygramma]|nr:hypothetical protein DFH06DRAFT_1141155 [Mycena polygramma]
MSNIEDGMSRGGQVLMGGELVDPTLDGEKVRCLVSLLFSCQCGWVWRVKARGGYVVVVLLPMWLGTKLPCNIRESKIEWEARRRGEVLLEKLSCTRHDPCCMCYIPNTVSSVPNSSHTSFPLNWKERQTFNLEVASSTLAVAGGLVRILGMVIFVQWWYGCFLPLRERSQSDSSHRPNPSIKS